MTDTTRIPGFVSRYPPGAVALMYLLLAVVFAAIGFSGMWSSFSLLAPEISPWWTLATAVPACALVLLKRRAPLLGLCLASAVLLVDVLTVGGIVPLLVMLELFHARTVALPSEKRGMLKVVIVATVIAVGAALFITGDPRAVVAIGLQVGALLGIVYWHANSEAQARELIQLHERRAQDAARLAEFDREAAVQGERDRMARELHDVVAGHISAVAIRSEAALALPGEDTPERRALASVRDASLEAHATLRSMIRVLRSGDEEFRLSPGRGRLSELIETANASGVRARLDDGIEGELPAPVDQAIGRIVQESLANAVRYASGGEVAVRLAEEPAAVRVDVVSSGGSVLDGLAGSGMGLELLGERARALGGSFSAGARGTDAGDAGSWVVSATLPRTAAA